MVTSKMDEREIMNDYTLTWEQLEAVARAAAVMTKVAVPDTMTTTLQLTVQLSHDGNVTVYSPAVNGHQIPVYDSETDVWAGFRSSS
jgi:hypothetical protein